MSFRIHRLIIYSKPLRANPSAKRGEKCDLTLHSSRIQFVTKHSPHPLPPDATPKNPKTNIPTVHVRTTRRSSDVLTPLGSHRHIKALCTCSTCATIFFPFRKLFSLYELNICSVLADRFYFFVLGINEQGHGARTITCVDCRFQQDDCQRLLGESRQRNPTSIAIQRTINIFYVPHTITEGNLSNALMYSLRFSNVLGIERLAYIVGPIIYDVPTYF